MTQLRRLHLLIGFTLVPFLFAQALTGFLQAMGMFPPAVVRVHSWSIVTRYLAFPVATGLAFLAVSGGVLYLNMRLQQLRRKAAAKKPTVPDKHDPGASAP